MANPNLLNATSIYGKHVAQHGSSSTQTILTCPSNKLIKILTINIHSDGSNNYHKLWIAGKQISGGASNQPPGDGNITLGSFYLMEGESVTWIATGNEVDCFISYEEIDDA
tara:strand:- start:32 stop:364 length:333 start_codon:yes stop_codon:yes gene_type:complete